MPSLHLVCPHCGGINRVPEERLGENPACGKCHGAVLPPAPVDLDGQSFDRFIGRNDLPVVVDFWAAWCGPCKMMAPVFAQTAAQLSQRMRFAKVDTEHARDIAARYNIRSIPTLAVFWNGREIDRMAGALDQGSLVHWLQRHL